MALASSDDAAINQLVTHLVGGKEVDLAKARVLAKQGHDLEALAIDDVLIADRDPALSEKAAEQAVDLRLRNHSIKPGAAADLLQARILDGRLAGDEWHLRLEVARLRAQQGQTALAFAELREIEASDPPSADQARQITSALFRSLVTPVDLAAKPAPGSDIASVSMMEDNLDLLPPGEQANDVLMALAAKLTALGLPEQAAGMLRRLLSSMPQGTPRARTGAQLAQLSLEQNDGRAARAALADTEAPGLPIDLSDLRSMISARSSAADNDPDAALKALTPLHTAEAEDMRARELASKQDWPGEMQALTALVKFTIPATGMLDTAGMDLVLRLANATVRVGNPDALIQLVNIWSSRFPDPKKAGILRLLAMPPISATKDILRSARELAVMQAALAPVIDDAH